MAWWRRNAARRREFFNFAVIDGFDEGVAGVKVAVERAGADAGLACDFVEAGAGPALVKTSLATSRMRSRLRWASARGLRAEGGDESFFFGIPKTKENFPQPERCSVYLYIRRLSPFYSAAARMSILARSSRVAS
jgi:hypothetical protein